MDQAAEAEIIQQMGAKQPQDIFTFAVAGYRNCVLCGLELQAEESALIEHLEHTHTGAMLQLMKQTAAIATVTAAQDAQNDKGGEEQ